MADKISVITVVYNDVKGIRHTMESFFAQTWQDKEYIVIDGGSNDGTADVINEYSDRLVYWCSERDNGLYDAMNKGISKVTGDWIIILNSGDCFVCPTSLESAITAIQNKEDIDVIYGNSIEKGNATISRKEASENVKLLEYSPIYRHGSSLVRTSVQKKFLYDVNKEKKFGYALDWYMIYSIFKSNYKFRKVNVDIEMYQKDGISNHHFKNLWYNYLITSQNKFCLRKLLFLFKSLAFHIIKNSSIYKWLKAFLLEFMVNDILPIIPFWNIRKIYLKTLKTKIGKGSFIMKKTYIMNANLLKIGEYSHLNRGCFIDARGHVEIGNNVSISHNVNIVTGSHDINDPDFIGIFKPIKINDYAFIGIGATILQGVEIGKGAVVCAGAVVTNNVDDFNIVSGVPAKVLKKRDCAPRYHCIWNTPLT